MWNKVTYRQMNRFYILGKLAKVHKFTNKNNASKTGLHGLNITRAFIVQLLKGTCKWGQHHHPTPNLTVTSAIICLRQPISSWPQNIPSIQLWTQPMDRDKEEEVCPLHCFSAPRAPPLHAHSMLGSILEPYAGKGAGGWGPNLLAPPPAPTGMYWVFCSLPQDHHCSHLQNEVN